KDVSQLRVGDTLTTRARPASEPLPGYREVKPMVFCGLFPVDTDQFSDLRDALEKLALNDAALSYEPETSQALGFGFRCGFLGLLLAGDKVDALSMVVHKDKAYPAGRALTERLRAQIPRQQFEVVIQAAIGAKIIARESVKPIRKDVIAKCYGGDVTRKRKLLEKQKAGKKRMKQVGRIEVPQEAFLSVLEIGSGDGKA